MTENNFWEILDKLDWTHEGDDEKVMEPVKNALDFTLFALADGTVKFSKPKRMVEVVPAEVAAE